MSIKKHAFRTHKDCEISKCPIRRNRLATIAKLEGDIALLTQFGLPSPKAKSELDMKQHFQKLCDSGECRSY